MVTAKQLINSIKSRKTRGKVINTPLGEVGYDNPRDDIERVKKVREIETNHLNLKGYGSFLVGTSQIYKTAADGLVMVGSSGTSNDFVLAEGGGLTLFRNPTGTNTCIFPNGPIDMNTHKITNVVDPTANQEVATKKYVDDNDANTTYLGGTNLTLSSTTFNVDDAFLKNNAADIGVGLQLTQDNSSADTQFTPQVLYNTDETPPTASGFPIGTLYIQYTA